LARASISSDRFIGIPPGIGIAAAGLEEAHLDEPQVLRERSRGRRFSQPVAGIISFVGSFHADIPSDLADENVPVTNGLATYVKTKYV
jgi:hypothetical protein